jgi:hypothetical protein
MELFTVGVFEVLPENTILLFDLLKLMGFVGLLEYQDVDEYQCNKRYHLL